MFDVNNYRFILEPYTTKKSRYSCPACGRPYVFTRYIDLQKKEYLGEHVGKCDRIQKCNYHYPPKQFFADQETFSGPSGKLGKPQGIPVPSKKDLPPTYMDLNEVEQSMDPSLANNFISFLQGFQKVEVVDKLRMTYKIGSGTHWKGSTIFWQMDQNKRVRTGKVMQYDQFSGRKQKIHWVHSLQGIKDFQLKQCLYGLHLLNSDNSKPIAIVESEKTAVIASIPFPQFTWMATGGLQNLKKEMLAPLAGRKVVLFPDAGCYTIWKNKAEALSGNLDISVSQYLRSYASQEEKAEGYDIADYIVQIWNSRRPERR